MGEGRRSRFIDDVVLCLWQWLRDKIHPGLCEPIGEFSLIEPTLLLARLGAYVSIVVLL